MIFSLLAEPLQRETEGCSHTNHLRGLGESLPALGFKILICSDACELDLATQDVTQRPTASDHLGAC